MRQQNPWRYVLSAVIAILMTGCNGQQGGTKPGNQAQEEEPDETFANYQNAEIEPFTSFVEIERQGRQITAANGNQMNIWWFADTMEIVGITQIFNQYSMTYNADFVGPTGDIAYTLLPQGQDAQGNYLFVEEWSKNRFTIAADESWLNVLDLKTYRRVTAEECDKVLTYAKRKSLYVEKKYWVFTDFFHEIKKAYRAGPDPDADMEVWGDAQAVYVLAQIPLYKKYAFAEYKGWSNVNCDAKPQGQTSDGGTTYLVTRNDMNIRTSVEVSADRQQLKVGEATYHRLTIRKATRLIENLRDEQDKQTTPQQFDQMYQTQANLAANKMQYINNLGVKEVYKFAARSDLRDAQQRMRQIRQRAQKIGYQMQPSPYEGQDPSYDPGQKYQQERDGVRYGQPKYRTADPTVLGQ